MPSRMSGFTAPERAVSTTAYWLVAAAGLLLISSPIWYKWILMATRVRATTSPYWTLDHESSRRRWEEAEDLTTVMRLNKAYLRGQLAWSPYRFGTLDDEGVKESYTARRLSGYGIVVILDRKCDYNSFPSGVTARVRGHLHFALPQQDGITADPRQLARLIQLLTSDSRLWTTVSEPVKIKMISSGRLGSGRSS